MLVIEWQHPSPLQIKHSPEEISSLGRRVDLSLKSILPLTQHSRRHDLIAILAGDQISSFEKDGSPVSKWQALPLWLGSQCSIDSGRDIL